MKNRKRLLCGALVLTMAATTVFATSPMTKAETIEIVQDASVNYANTLTIHAKGSNLTFYAWDSTGSITGAWPGDKMTDEGNGWCSYSTDKDILGFLVCSGDNKITPNGADVTDKKSGEWWLADGAWSETNPDGGSSAKPTPTPTGKDDPTPTPTPTKPADKEGTITVNSITPESGTELTAGEKCNISVDAETDINDGVLYYQFEVTCNGEYVGEHHYTKNSTYTFTPEAGKQYKAIIFVQAHDEDNTTEKIECTYTTSGEVNGGSDADKPIETSKPSDTPATTEPSEPEDSDDTPVPTKPSKTTAPDKTATPKPTPTATATATPKVTPTVKPTGTSPSNINTDNTASGGTNLGESSNVDIKISCSKKPPLILGKSVLLEATNSTSATGLTYRFSVKKSGQTGTQVLQEYSSDSTCIWSPSSKGTYTVIVECKEGSKEAVSVSATYVVKGLSVSAKASSTSVKKGKKVKITASAANANGTVKYKYVVKLNKKNVASTGYKTKKTFTFKASKKGTYTISVYAKDSKSVVTKTLKVKAK